MNQERAYFIGVDVGSTSVRAALVDSSGKVIKTSIKQLKIWNVKPGNYEQSSADIWQSCIQTIKDVSGDHKSKTIKGIGFDATCSLVVLGINGEPLPVSESGNNEQNVIMWMDHRAELEAALINQTNHPILKYVGGKVSLEMELPKVLWIKNHLKVTWSQIGHFFDLPDFLTWKATGSETRSLCSLICKWNYERFISAKQGWNKDFMEKIGLGELIENNFSKIGSSVLVPGEPCGKGLCEEVADILGLEPGTPVGTSIIDAHAGGLGMIGTHALNIPSSMSSRLGLICGTSTCHMAVSDQPVMVPGVWGPYYSAMVPNMWLNEAGQSASGMLIDHILSSHPAGIKLLDSKLSTGEIRGRLKQILENLAQTNGLSDMSYLTKELHMWPDYHGNRSPLANPTLKGMITGLTINNGIDQLAILYLATLQALAYGTRHIIDALTDAGYNSFQALVICGGLSKDPLFNQIQADAVGMPLLIPHEKESVLLGAAILGACASRHFPSIEDAISKMSGEADVILPNSDIKVFHDKKYKVFLKMVQDQIEYNRIMV